MCGWFLGVQEFYPLPTARCKRVMLELGKWIINWQGSLFCTSAHWHGRSLKIFWSSSFARYSVKGIMISKFLEKGVFGVGFSCQLQVKGSNGRTTMLQTSGGGHNHSGPKSTAYVCFLVIT